MTDDGGEGRDPGGSSGSPERVRALRHELKTPIHQILGYAGLVADELRDQGRAAQVADLEKIQAAARNLDALLDRLEAGAGTAPLLSVRTPEDQPSRPIERAEAPGSNSPTRPAPGDATPAGAAKRLLVVDDNELNLEMLSRRLRVRGYDVSVARSGTDALVAIRNGRFDAVLLDVVMPGLSGLDVLRSIREKLSPADLPVIMATAQDESDKVVEALRFGANDYVTKPLDFPVVLARVETHLRLKEAKEKAERLAEELERRNRFIQKTFGRYLSDDVVSRLLEGPGGLTLGGEKKTVTILMADLRGFSMLSEAFPPEQVMTVLNAYLGAMTRVINRYRGTVDEFIGDAVLALFGAPFTAPDDATRAVACALEMQAAMDDVNAAALAEGLPPIEMGIALDTGEVLVGNIGSEERAKYGVVGRHVNLVGRIESFTVGGQILISESTRQAAGEAVVTGVATTLNAKGFREPITVHELVGIGAPYSLALPPGGLSLRQLPAPLRVAYSLLTDKRVEGAAMPGEFTAVCLRGAELRTEPLPALLADLRIELRDEGNDAQFFAKVVERSTSTVRVRFTSVPASIAGFLRGLTASGPEGDGASGPSADLLDSRPPTP
jgi:class 3 adenylate cyclase